MSKGEDQKRIYITRKIVAISLLTLTMAATLIWSFNGQESNIQQFAGIHIDKLLTIENKPYVSMQEEISPEDIYSVSQNQNSWAVDPREPRNLIIEGTSIVHIKVLSIREAEILPKYENFYNFIPYTPLDVEILDTIYGKDLSGKKTIYIGGGDIRISNLLDSWIGTEYEGLEKMGLTKLPREEQESKFISYTSDYNYKMVPEKEYVLILADQETEDEIYTVMALGYGIFEIIQTHQGEKVYKNVITRETYDLDF
ncbi:hypothetical protein LG307_11435 [Sutcliffiella horikoshii]|uniref:hypothetical protein n=1 Tax=Sutcliffiella horikoshii TaxID=79883 RepID=UPI00384C75E5